MRGLVVLAILGLALASGGGPLASPNAATSLRITYWEDAANASASVTWTLRCGPPRGSLPRPARACARLAARGPKPFAPIRGGVACTQVYGGPQKALVVGTVAGGRVWATFTRADGCEIARWQGISPWLVPPAA